MRFPPLVETTLEAVATHLGLDRSSTIRFLIMEKGRELGLIPGKQRAPETPEPPPVARSAAAPARRRTKAKS